jgi:hypothetical protein
VSYPYRPKSFIGKFCGFSSGYKVPLGHSCHVVDAWLLKSCPLSTVQSSGSDALHPSGPITQVSEDEVDASTLSNWGGVPTLSAKVDHGPSFPLLTTLAIALPWLENAQIHYSPVTGTTIGSGGGPTPLFCLRLFDFAVLTTPMSMEDDAESPRWRT